MLYDIISIYRIFYMFCKRGLCIAFFQEVREVLSYKLNKNILPSNYLKSITQLQWLAAALLDKNKINT